MAIVSESLNSQLKGRIWLLTGRLSEAGVCPSSVRLTRIAGEWGAIALEPPKVESPWQGGLWWQKRLPQKDCVWPGNTFIRDSILGSGKWPAIFEWTIIRGKQKPYLLKPQFLSLQHLKLSRSRLSLKITLTHASEKSISKIYILEFFCIATDFEIFGNESAW